jgi:DNA-binding response OmpR family regulator
MVNCPRALVADSDPGIRRLLRRHFGNAGYDVITADTGLGVLDQLLARGSLGINQAV